MLEVNGIVKKYNNFTLKCDINVEPGRITGIIGPNGAGKSTLFNAVLGLVRIDEGEIKLFGKNIKSLTDKERENIGVVLSESGFSGYLKVEDVGKMLKAFYSDFDEEEFNKKIADFKLDPKKKVKELSTGMKAKLHVIAALSHDAKLLILDEPTAGLDVIAREEVIDMLRQYMEEDDSRTIVISSHISSDLENLCDDFYMINDGEIIIHEDTDKLLSSYAILKVDKDMFESLDKKYLLRAKEESYGYMCLTNERQFYMENYPDTVIEKSGIDELIGLMIRGKEL
ncbi:MAG: ABC transporter ATP-binding protein [Lachnospiraceae bacterium]|nr:ABC transporter ATP-binding protein [Lachnospiraceae bacterium]